ncbi:hypothetical protein [Paenibacillus amylolyticus]
MHAKQIIAFLRKLAECRFEEGIFYRNMENVLNMGNKYETEVLFIALY